jgi:hypothetical protein
MLKLSERKKEKGKKKKKKSYNEAPKHQNK